MAHRMQTEFAECDLFHLAIGGMIFDPIFVAAKTVARMEYRWVLVSGLSQFIEFSAGQLTEAIVMRLEVREHLRIHVQLQQVLQSAIDAVEIHAAAIEREMIRAMRRVGDFRDVGSFHIRPRARV